MKLATLKDGTRDGQLVVVSRDLHTAVIADAIAPTLQRVIEDWAFYAPQLSALYETLNAGRARRAFGFEPGHCMAPLPRAYRLLAHRFTLDGADLSPTPKLAAATSTVTDDAAFADGPVPASPPRRKTTKSAASAVTAALTVANVDRVPFRSERFAARRADALLGARDDIVAFGVDPALRFSAGLAVILSDIPAGAAPARASESVCLVMLASSVEAGTADSAQRSPLTEQDRCSFSSVAVTPDELGASWSSDRLGARLDVQVNGRRQVLGNAAIAIPGDFSLLTATIARTQGVAAGTILISIPDVGSEAGDVAGAGAGLVVGDRIRVALADAHGESVLGMIEQSVTPNEDV